MLRHRGHLTCMVRDKKGKKGRHTELSKRLGEHSFFLTHFRGSQRQQVALLRAHAAFPCQRAAVLQRAVS